MVPVPSIEPGQEEAGWTEEHHLMMRRMFRVLRILRILIMLMTRIVILVVKLMSGMVMMKMKSGRITFSF